MDPVSLQGQRADAPADPDLVLRNTQVGDDPDRSSQQGRADSGDGVALAGQQPAQRLESRRGGGEDDDQDDHQGRHVLHATKAGGEAPGRRPASHRERNQEHKRGEDVTGVVERIGQDAGRSAGRRGCKLDRRGGAEHHGADQDGACRCSLIGGGVMVVRRHASHSRGRDPRP